MRSGQLRLALAAAFRRPTLEQKEAYGRFAHTLAAANLIGGVTLYFSDTQEASMLAYRLAMMLGLGVILFCVGAVFAKGE